MKNKRFSIVTAFILAPFISIPAQVVDSGDLTQHIYDILASMTSSYGGEDGGATLIRFSSFSESHSEVILANIC